MTFRAYHYIEGTTVTHVAGWTGRRWRVPCGNLGPPPWRVATFTLPLCRSCVRVTAQTHPAPARRQP